MHFHIRLLHFTLKKSLSEIYAFVFIRTFALSMISIFIPMYLLKEVGLPFSSVLIYFISVYLFLILGYLIGYFISLKIGVGRVIMYSIPFYIFSYFFLYEILSHNISLVLIGATMGIAHGIYWFGYSTNFATFSDRKHRGEEVKLWYILAALVGIIGPLLGGILLDNLGFYIVFVLAILLLIVSVFPLLGLDERKLVHRLSFHDIFQKVNLENAPRYFVEGMRQTSESIFWPVFIFYFIPGYTSLGFVIAGSTLFSSFAIWFIGDKVDVVSRKLFTDFSSIIYGLVSVAKIFVKTFSQIFTIGILSHVSFGSAEIAAHALSFDECHNKKMLGFFMMREIIISLSGIFLLAVVLFSGLELIEGLKLSFILLGAASLLQKLFQ